VWELFVPDQNGHPAGWARRAGRREAHPSRAAGHRRHPVSSHEYGLVKSDVAAFVEVISNFRHREAARENLVYLDTVE
jgi:hypothetical protein